MTEVDVIRLRLEKAHESLKEAETLKNNGLFRGTNQPGLLCYVLTGDGFSSSEIYFSSKLAGMIAFFDKE